MEDTGVVAEGGIARVVVTGAGGYLGSILSDFLRRGLGLAQAATPTSAELDVRDEQAVRRLVARERPGAVFHLAAKAGTDWCEEHFEEARQVNVAGSLNVVRCALDAGAKVVYFSSACLYPDNKKAYDESGPLAAYCKYTETKLEAEEALRPFARRILNIRMRQPFSNHRHPRNLIEKLAGYSDFIDEANSMSHVEECFPVVWQLMVRGVVGAVNLTNEGWTTPYRIALMIRKHWNPNMTIRRISYQELLTKVAAVRVNSLVDNSRLHQLGYRLQPVEAAIEDCLERRCALGEYDWSRTAQGVRSTT